MCRPSTPCCVHQWHICTLCPGTWPKGGGMSRVIVYKPIGHCEAELTLLNFDAKPDFLEVWTQPSVAEFKLLLLVSANSCWWTDLVATQELPKAWYALTWQCNRILLVSQSILLLNMFCWKPIVTYTNLKTAWGTWAQWLLNELKHSIYSILILYTQTVHLS